MRERFMLDEAGYEQSTKSPNHHWTNIFCETCDLLNLINEHPVIKYSSNGLFEIWMHVGSFSINRNYFTIEHYPYSLG